MFGKKEEILKTIKGQMEMVKSIDDTLDTLEYNIPKEKFEEVKEIIMIVRQKHYENAKYELENFKK